MDIYIIEYYPGGWINCERIDEEKQINKYIQIEDPPMYKGYTIGDYAFDRFYYAINRGFQEIVSNGWPIWFANNCAYVVVEGNDPIDAVSKACDVIKVLRKDYNKREDV